MNQAFIEKSKSKSNLEGKTQFLFTDLEQAKAKLSEIITQMIVDLARELAKL